MNVVSFLKGFINIIKRIIPTEIRLAKLLKIILLIIAGSIVLIMSYWVNLPSSKLAATFITRANAYIPEDWVLSIASVENTFTGIELNNVEVAHKDNEQLKILFTKITADIISLELFRASIPVKMVFAGGEIKLRYNFLNSGLHLSAPELQPNAVPLVRQYKIIGGNPILSANAQYTSGQQQAALNINNLILNGDNSILADFAFSVPEKLTFNSVDMSVDLIKPNKTIDVELSGDITGTINTTIAWNETINQSNVTIEINSSVSAELLESENDLFDIFLKQYMEDDKLNVKISFQGQFQGLSIDKI